MVTFGKIISAEVCSGKEISGLLRKIMMMMMKSRRSGFSRGKLEAGRNELGLLYKWKNHFYEMKGDVGMALHEKERNKKMPT